jgi:hypothetical protein
MRVEIVSKMQQLEVPALPLSDSLSIFSYVMKRDPPFFVLFIYGLLSDAVSCSDFTAYLDWINE